MAIVNKPEEGNSAEVTAPQSEIPEQFRGKSPEDLVKMYQNLEQKLGSQSEELGQLRKLAEQQIRERESSAGSEDVDFFADPERAIEKMIRKHLSPYEEVVSKQREQAVVQRLDAEHPGWKDIAGAQDFQEWVAKSKVRTNLFVQANAADYDAANELLSTWKSLSGAKSESNDTARKAVERDRKLRAVSTEKGATGIDPRKILYREDLQSLKQKDPDRYQQLLPDITRAYQEGRVRKRGTT